MRFLGFGEEVRDFTGDKDRGYPTNADSLDCVGDSAVGGETLGKVKGDLDNCFNGGPPLQVLMEGGVVADFGVDLVEGNVFQERSVRFAFVICACEFCESGGEKLLFIDHNGKIRTEKEEGCQEGGPQHQGDHQPCRCAV